MTTPSGIVLPHAGEIGLKHNYRFIKATEEEITRVIARYKNITERAADAMRQFDPANFAKEWLHVCRRFPDLLWGLDVQECHNIVPSVLRDEFALLISGTTVTPTFKANYFALGSGSTAAANADVQLGTETIRALFTDRSSYTNIAYLDVFFPTASVAGNTYNEAGIFVDGTSSANTGYLLSRVVINLTLGSSQTLTVNCSITIS